MQQAVRQKAQDTFDRRQSEDLARISAEGVELAAEQAEVVARGKELAATLPALEKAYNAMAERVEKLQAEMALLPGDSAAAPADGTLTRKTDRRDACRQTLDALQRRAAESERYRQGQERIAELTDRQTQLAAEYAELERQTFLTEAFMRTKVRLLEEKINNRFKLARFRLFEQQVNGALNEVCEVLGPDLVPYNAGLNHAAQIHTGIDIINTLAVHYGFSAPVFIDNAEAVTQGIDTSAQLIRLVVAEGVKELQVVEDEGVRQTQPNGKEYVAPTVSEPAASVRKGPGF